MDFDDTREEAEFRKEVRLWLEANAAHFNKPPAKALSDAEALEVARAWQVKRAESGYAKITWPKEYGGLGGTPIQAVIYEQEESRYYIPNGFFHIGLGMCMPTMIAYATKEQLKRYVPKALSGEEIWCQLFSEPVAGSDLAGIRTRAEKDGDEWVINGQKVWTSGAHYADYAILITRSDPTKPKHKGLTMFFIDMHAPGVEVRPIKQINGGAKFNEVFFTDLRIPDSQRLGEVSDGWRVALTTLMNERMTVSGDTLVGPKYRQFLELAKLVQLEDGPAIEDPQIRERLADWYIKRQGLRLTRYRTLTKLSKGEAPGPEASLTKVTLAPLLQEEAAYAMELMGQAGIVMDADIAPLNAAYQESALVAPGYRIAGGTDEILRNIIAERVLGLPGDVRVDKTAPFNELPSGNV